MIKVIHTELKPWPPDPGAERAEIGGYFVDYVGPVPTLAEVEARFNPPPPPPTDIEALTAALIRKGTLTATDIADEKTRGR